MQQKFEKIRDLLVREKWDELTADERQMLEEWRQEEESHEQLYRRLAEPGALRRHFDELAAVDTERALAYNRKLLQRYALRRVVRWSLPYAAVLAWSTTGKQLCFRRSPSQQALQCSARLLPMLPVHIQPHNRSVHVQPQKIHRTLSGSLPLITVLRFFSQT